MLTEDEKKMLVELIYKIDDRETLNMVVKEVNNVQDYMVRKASRTLQPGDKVQFKDRYGSIVIGVISKVNPKTVYLRSIPKEPGNRSVEWRVSPTMLSHVE